MKFSISTLYKMMDNFKYDYLVERNGYFECIEMFISYIELSRNKNTETTNLTMEHWLSKLTLKWPVPSVNDSIKIFSNYCRFSSGYHKAILDIKILIKK